MRLKEYRLNLTSDGSGDDTATTERGIIGRLYKVYINDGDLADNWDITLTFVNQAGDTETLLTLTNKSADTSLYPRHQVHGNDGTALTLDGTRIAYDLPVIAGVVTATLADGGDTKSGQVLLYVLE